MELIIDTESLTTTINGEEVAFETNTYGSMMHNKVFVEYEGNYPTSLTVTDFKFNEDGNTHMCLFVEFTGDIANSMDECVSQCWVPITYCDINHAVRYTYNGSDTTLVGGFSNSVYMSVAICKYNTDHNGEPGGVFVTYPVGSWSGKFTLGFEEHDANTINEMCHDRTNKHVLDREETNRIHMLASSTHDMVREMYDDKYEKLNVTTSTCTIL